MIRNALRFGLRVTLLAGTIVGLVTLVRRRSTALATDDGPVPWGPRPVAVPPLPAWLEPVGKVCPTTHPVKAKQSSNLFHVPGGVNYERTVPDRCYRDDTAAEAEGFVKSKR